MSGTINDLRGNVYGRLTVLRDTFRRTSRGEVIWECLCECSKIINVYSGHLRRGNTKSCGCLQIEHISALGRSNITHGASNTPEYGILANMIQRCNNPNDHRYSDYGGRGITVCDRWKHSFENFYADMGPIPSPEHSIDRRDNDGNYEPNNCRWATDTEQCNNKRNNILVTYRGKDYTIAELAREYNINYNLLLQRITRNKWTVEKAVETPVILDS